MRTENGYGFDLTKLIRENFMQYVKMDLEQAQAFAEKISEFVKDAEWLEAHGQGYHVEFTRTWTCSRKEGINV